jgi:hypothetical protein
MSSYSSNVNNSLQTWNNLDGLKFKNRKYTKCGKKAVVRISESDANKHKLLYRCDDKSEGKTFIDWCKLINYIEVTIIVRKCANNINQILDKVKKI